MTDPVIRPRNGLLLIKLQTAEGSPAVPSASTDVVLYETDSLDRSDPYKMEASNESTGSFAAGAPLVLGQPATFNFRSRLKGIGSGGPYTSSVKPPVHAALSACGWLGAFTASVASAALTAGTTQSGTLGTGFATTAQIYRGMPLLFTGTHAPGRVGLVTDYSAGKVAKLVDIFGTALDATDSVSLPANWSYAPTSPKDSSTRATMHPAATIYYYEDGLLYQFVDCRGTVDLDGTSSGPGFGMFSMTGIFVSKTDATVPSNPVFPTQSAPILVQGASVQPVFQINGRGLPISKWSLKNGGAIESPEDPNTTIGYGAGQISDRAYQLEIDPLMTLVATRNALADIAAFSQYSGGIIMGTTSGNRVSLTMPLIQPTDSAPGTRGKNRSETLHYSLLTPGVDNAGRDGDAVLTFF